MSKSLVTFIRRSLKIKGSTEHNGRGCYTMWAKSEDSQEDPSYDEIKSKIETLLPKWKDKGYIEESSITDKEILITFSKSEFDPNYRKFYKSATGLSLGQVLFTSNFNL